MERIPFPIKQPPHQYQAWEEVFKNPGPIILVKSFVTAESNLKKKGALNPNHPKTDALKDAPLKAPVLSHWVRHQEFGDYLVDAGLNSTYQKKSRGGFRGILVPFFLGKSAQEKDHDILSRIKENQLDLKGIFFTHLHFDHIAGVADLPDDLPVQYAAGKDEIYFVVKKGFLFRSPDFLEGVDTLYEIDFTDAIDMPVLGKCVDIFADNSLWAISTPGHTTGHISFLVNGNSGSGPVLITGDACFFKVALEQGIGPGTYSTNIEQAQETVEKIALFSQKYPEVKFVFGHERP